MVGADFTYDAAGRLTGGTVNEIRLDLDAEGAASGLRISGLSIPAQGLLDEPAQLLGPSARRQRRHRHERASRRAGRPRRLDRVRRRPRRARRRASGAVTDAGGHDFFLNIGGSGTVVGDVLTASAAAGRFVTYDAGDDSLIGRVTSIDQTFFGDARQVLSRSQLSPATT